MSFRIMGLDPAPFAGLWGLGDAALAARSGARRVMVDVTPGYPDRVELRDAEPGESVLLVNHVHQPARNPYRASHAIYVLEGSKARYDRVGVVPEVLRRRLISLRGFDAADLMIDADVVEGAGLESRIGAMLADRRVAYLHAHYARRGCYAARIEREDHRGSSSDRPKVTT